MVIHYFQLFTKLCFFVFYFNNWLRTFSLSSALSQSLFLASFSFSFPNSKFFIQLQLLSCFYLSVQDLFSFHIQQCNSLPFPCHLSQPFLHISVSIFVTFHLIFFSSLFISSNYLFFSSISFLSIIFLLFLHLFLFQLFLYSLYDLSATFTISGETGTLCSPPHSVTAALIAPSPVTVSPFIPIFCVVNIFLFILRDLSTSAFELLSTSAHFTIFYKVLKLSPYLSCLLKILCQK